MDLSAAARRLHLLPLRRGLVPTPKAMASEIHDYAVIGDCRSAALVSREGSIDWLCWPRFDSPAQFSALLDEGAGRWSLRPARAFRSERWYVEDTNVLQTRFSTDTGTLAIVDLMPVASESEKQHRLTADHEILRLVECERGEVDVEMLLDVRPDYGRERARVRPAGKLGVRLETREGLLVLRSDLDCVVHTHGEVTARGRLREGERCHFSLSFADEWQAVFPPLGAWSQEAIERSIAWWRDWVSRLQYDGPVRRSVVRSALALKLMIYAPSGAIVAAPTTSLPERVGGDLNWDYRFCWLRDASFTVRALFGLGFYEEAEAFLSWLLHSTRLTQPRLRVLYDVYGNRPGREEELSHLGGYRGSRPVRIGNAAADQLQLDVYGDVIDAAVQFARRGGTFDRDTQRMICAFGDYVCRHWRQADEGIWEPRSGRAENTHSRVLCWTALDRLLELHREGFLRRAPAERFAAEREAIARDIEERAFSAARNSYVATLGGDRLDASLLLLPWYGFAEASSEKMKATYAAIKDELGAGGPLLYRYRMRDLPEEGAFGICSFWGVEYLAMGGGSADDAAREHEELCGYANDVGLFAEEIDPKTGAALGNFPQAFTHVGLISAALTVARRLEREKPRTVETAHGARRAHGG